MADQLAGPWEDRQDYFARHWRLRQDRGRAKAHKCWRCLENGIPKQASDWAQIHTETGEDPFTDYVPLCRSCHIRYDKSGHRQPHSDAARQKMSVTRRLAYAEGRRVGANTFNSAKTHCPQGHPYDEENTYRARDGSRMCKKCQRESTRRWREKRRGGGDASGSARS